MSVRFKFKNDLDYHSVHCDGLNISVRDLKRAIIRQKKLGKMTDFDLVVTNVATDHVFADENELVHKNTTVTVQRAPLPDGQKKVWEEDVMTIGGAVEAGMIVPAGSVSSILTSGVHSSLSEGDRITNMMSSSAELYKEEHWTKYKGQKAYPEGSKAPHNWKCKTCFQNHWASDCPFVNSDLKRTTGIPRSFLMPSQEKVLGAKIDPQGKIVVNEMEAQAYSEKKVEKSPWVADDRPAAPKIQIPDELVCRVCNEILTDAVMMPCCADAACDECAREGIIGSDKSRCPLCQEEGVSPEDVIPYRLFRDKVSTFQNQTGYSKQKKQPPSPQKQSSNQFIDLKPTLPDIVLPDPNDVKFNTLINQKGNTQEIKAPNLDFTYTAPKPDSTGVILPELFSGQKLFAPSNATEKHSTRGDTSDDPIIVAEHSPRRHDGRNEHSPSRSARHEGKSEHSPPRMARHEVRREHSPRPSDRDRQGGSSPRRSISPAQRYGELRASSRLDSPSSPGEDLLAGMGQRLREDKERLLMEMNRSPPPTSQHLTFTRREDRPSPFMDKRTPSPASRRTPTPTSRRSPSPSRRHRRTEPPPLSPTTRGVVSPTQRREIVSPTRTTSSSQRPLTPTPAEYQRHDLARSVPGLPPPTQQPPPHAYLAPLGYPPPVAGSVYTSSAMAGYVPPQNYAVPGSDVDPLAAFNAAMQEMDRNKHRRRSPGGHRSPPRAYRERRGRSRDRDRYYREKERRRTPDRYRYDHRTPAARSPDRRATTTRPETAAPPDSGWKDKENTPVEAEPRYREEEKDESRYRRSEDRTRSTRYDEKERRSVPDDRYHETTSDRRSETSDRRHESDRRSERRGEERKVEERRGEERRGDDRRGEERRGEERREDRRVEDRRVDEKRIEERRTDTSNTRDYDSRRGYEDRYSSRHKKSKYEERIVVGDSVKVDRFGFHTREYKSGDTREYKSGDRYNREEQKYSEDLYERDRRKSDGRRNDTNTPSLSPSPGSGSRLGAILYEDDVQKSKGRWEGENEGEERRDKKSKKSKKKSREDEDTDDEGGKSKKRKHKKKKKRKEGSPEGEKEGGGDGAGAQQGVGEQGKQDNAALASENVPSLVAAYDSQEEGKPTANTLQEKQEAKEMKEQEVASDNFVKPVEEAEKDIIPKGFKNSFSAVAEEKPPPVVLPTLVFDSTTSQLVAKKDESTVEAEETRPKSRSKSRRSMEPSVNNETKSLKMDKSTKSSRASNEESSMKSDPQDILDFTLQTDLSPTERLDLLEKKTEKSASNSKKELFEVKSSPAPPSTNISRDFFEPDNPLVKNDMSPDFKTNLNELKSHMQMAKKQTSLKQDEDVKLKVAEPDSTIDSALLVQQASLDHEVPPSHQLDSKTVTSPNILKKALNNIKDNDVKQPKKRKVEAPEASVTKDEPEVKKKKKKKRNKKSDSEDSSNNSEGEEDKDKESEDGKDEEDKEDSESDQEDDDKRKKKKKKNKKKKKKQEKKVLSMLKKMNKDDLIDLVGKKKKKKKKKKKQDSDSEDEKEKSVSKDKKRGRSSGSPDSRGRSSSRKRRVRSTSSPSSRSPSPPTKSSKRRDRTDSINSSTSNDIQVLEQSKKGSVKDRLGKRREDHTVDQRRRRNSGSVRLADFEDERHVKIQGEHFQISLENRKSSEKEEKRGKLSSVVQKRIDSKKDRARSRSRDRNRDDRSSRRRR